MGIDYTATIWRGALLALDKKFIQYKCPLQKLSAKMRYQNKLIHHSVALLQAKFKDRRYSNN